MLDVTGDSDVSSGTVQTFSLAAPISDFRQIVVCFENFVTAKSHTSSATTPNVFWAFADTASSSSYDFEFDVPLGWNSYGDAACLDNYQSAVYTLNHTYRPEQTRGSYTYYSGKLLQGSLSFYSKGMLDETSGVEHVTKSEYALAGNAIVKPYGDSISFYSSGTIWGGYRIFVGGIK